MSAQQYKLVGLLVKYSTETLVNWYCGFLNQSWADDFVIEKPNDWDHLCFLKQAADHFDYCLIMSTLENFIPLARQYYINEEQKTKEEKALFDGIIGNENETAIIEFCAKLDAIRAS